MPESIPLRLRETDGHDDSYTDLRGRDFVSRHQCVPVSFVNVILRAPVSSNAISTAVSPLATSRIDVRGRESVVPAAVLRG